MEGWRFTPGPALGMYCYREMFFVMMNLTVLLLSMLCTFNYSSGKITPHHAADTQISIVYLKVAVHGLGGCNLSRWKMFNYIHMIRHFQKFYWKQGLLSKQCTKALKWLILVSIVTQRIHCLIDLLRGSVIHTSGTTEYCINNRCYAVSCKVPRPWSHYFLPLLDAS